MNNSTSLNQTIYDFQNNLNQIDQIINDMTVTINQLQKNDNSDFLKKQIEKIEKICNQVMKYKTNTLNALKALEGANHESK